MPVVDRPILGLFGALRHPGGLATARVQYGTNAGDQRGQTDVYKRQGYRYQNNNGQHGDEDHLQHIRNDLLQQLSLIHI